MIVLRLDFTIEVLSHYSNQIKLNMESSLNISMLLWI